MRRIVLVVGIAVAVAGVGVIAAVSSSDGGAAPASDVLHIVCDEGGATIPVPEVVARADGVHIAVANPGEATSIDLRPVNGGPTDVVGTQLAPAGTTEAVFSIPPGRALVACVDEGTAFLGRTGEVLVRDDAGFWFPPELDCALTRNIELDTFVLEEPPEDTARRAVKGLLDTDELRKPGYPGTRWQGDLLIVVREGSSIARVTRGQNHGRWAVFVDVCPDNHLSEGEGG